MKKWKKCKKCKEQKGFCDFPKRKDSVDGYRNTCKVCTKQYNKKYFLQNYDRLRDGMLAKNREWSIKNTDKRKKYRKKWYKNNPSYNKEYYKANRQEIIKQNYEYKKERMKKDVSFMIAERLRSRLYKAIRYSHKTGSAIQDLGCSIEFLIQIIKEKFTHGMTWDNYGKWHIDHILPLSSFDLTNREQIKKACHYTNLQPLWAKDNLKKGAKIPTTKGV